MKDHFLLIEGIERDGHHNDGRYALFKEHIQKTVAIAVALHRRLPDGIMLEDQDFIMIGLKALWDCTDSYNPALNPNFWGYARPRVSGSMIDELRSSDTVSRSNRDMLKKIEHRRQAIEQEFRRESTFDEACAALGIDAEKAEELSEASSVNFVSLDSSPGSKYENGESDMTLAEVIADPHETGSISVSDRDGDTLELEKLLQRLEPIDRSVIRLYFFSGLRLNDIASAIGLTESRVSQVLSGALEKLRRFVISKENVFGRQHCE
jgi:RNA polymerase sigma factor for flagellar operon FliA